jgi:hypothetical protein
MMQPPECVLTSIMLTGRKHSASKPTVAAPLTVLMAVMAGAAPGLNSCQFALRFS